MFHVKQMKNNNYYCTAKDRECSGELFSIYFNKEYSVARTKIDQDEDMYRFYEINNYHSHQVSPNTVTDMVYFICRRIMMLFKQRIIQTKSKNPQILDYGCGNGDFLKYLQDKKINVTGVEKSLSSQRICKQKGLRVFSTVKDLPSTNYDAITLWHVLEHVSDPQKCIQALSEKLTTGGILVVAVPNIQSADSQFFKEEWAALDVPRHLWHFTPKGLVDILKTQGFDLFKKTPLLLDAYYISLLSARRKKMFFPWALALAVGTISNILGFFNKNYSSSVFVFKKTA